MKKSKKDLRSLLSKLKARNKKIISYFENVGAKLSYSTGKESLSITIRTLNDIDQALVLTNIINNALRLEKLDSNVLKLEKDRILRNIEDSKKRPATLLTSSISAKLFLNSRITDLSSGIFLMKRSVLEDAVPIASGHGEFMMEFIYNLEKKGNKVFCFNDFV